MKIATIALYEYSELSEKAKQKALDTWRETNDDPLMQSHMINLLKEKLEDRTITYTTDSIDVRYSLSNCQGDGFMFIGTVEWEGQEIEITHGDTHYCHPFTARFETGDLGSKDVDAFKAMYLEVCNEMERIGYNEIEYANSAESFEQACDANEYTFEEDGTMRNDSHEGMKCPLCVQGTLEHEEAGTTQIHICDACPAVVVEWWDNKNTTDLVDRLTNPKKYGKI